MQSTKELRKYYTEEYFSKINRGSKEFEKFKAEKLPKELIESLLLLNPKKNEKILDVGCGRGEMVFACKQKGAKAFGIDFSFNALKFGKKLGLKNLVQADAISLPFKNNSFDKIVFLEVIEHIPKELEHQLLSELNRVLKKNGLLVITTAPNAFVAKPLYFVAKLLGMKRGLNEQIHVNEKTFFSLANSLKKANFKPKVWVEFDAEWFKAAVGGKKGQSFFNLFLPFLRWKPLGFLVDKTPLSIFLGIHVFAVSKKL